MKLIYVLLFTLSLSAHAGITRKDVESWGMQTQYKGRLDDAPDPRPVHKQEEPAPAPKEREAVKRPSGPVMCADGTYVAHEPCTQCGNGKYVAGDCHMAPDGSYTGD